MSYTYLQEQGEESSAECFSDIPLSALLKSKNIPERCYSSDSETESCHASQSGMTCKHLMGNRGEVKSMSCVEASPAKIYPVQEKEPDSMVLDLDYGRNTQESYRRYGLDMYSRKTRHYSELGDLQPCCQTLPAWGIMQDGELWEVGVKESRTGKECGCWPAVRCFMHKDALTDRGKSNLGEVVHGANPDRVKEGDRLNPDWTEWLLNWPIGWTDLKRLGTGKIQSWRQECFQFSRYNSKDRHGVRHERH